MDVVGGIILSLQINDFTFFCGFISLICFISPLISMHPPPLSTYPLPHPAPTMCFLFAYQYQSSWHQFCQKSASLLTDDTKKKTYVGGGRGAYCWVRLALPIKYDIDVCCFKSIKRSFKLPFSILCEINYIFELKLTVTNETVPQKCFAKTIYVLGGSKL